MGRQRLSSRTHFVRVFHQSTADCPTSLFMRRGHCQAVSNMLFCFIRGCRGDELTALADGHATLSWVSKMSNAAFLLMLDKEVGIDFRKRLRVEDTFIIAVVSCSGVWMGIVLRAICHIWLLRVNQTPIVKRLLFNFSQIESKVKMPSCVHTWRYGSLPVPHWGQAPDNWTFHSIGES